MQLFGSFFRRAAPEEFGFLVADLHNIRLTQSPENGFPGGIHVRPEGFSQIGVKADVFSLGFGIGNGLFCSRFCRVIGQAQGAEMEVPALVDEAQIQLLKPQAGIRAGFPGKAEVAVSGLVKGDKCQGGKHSGINQNAIGGNSGFLQSANQKMPKGIIAHLSQKRSGAAIPVQCRQQVSRRAAGIGRHGGVSCYVRRLTGKINQQFTDCGYINHVPSLFYK